jgi:hypothetical protein
MARQQQMRGKIPLQALSGMLGKRAPASTLRIPKPLEGTNQPPENSIFGTFLEKLRVGAGESVLLLL